MATNKTLEQIRAVKTAWPVFVFVATIVLNYLKLQNDFELKLREINYAWEKEVVQLRANDNGYREEDDRINHRVDKLEQDLILHYKRKRDVE